MTIEEFIRNNEFELNTLIMYEATSKNGRIVITIYGDYLSIDIDGNAIYEKETRVSPWKHKLDDSLQKELFEALK